MEDAKPITETNLYAGFGRVTRHALKFWKNHIVKIAARRDTVSTLGEINQDLLTHNVVIFFDHHYAFDALPAALTLGHTLDNITAALIPYAVHLDMGVDQEGLPSKRYRLRTKAFQWLTDNIHKSNHDIRFLPVAREFEMETPRLRAIVDENFSGVNLQYLRSLVQFFDPQQVGRVCILSPMAGLALPGKPALHPQLYRSMKLVQTRWNQTLPFYLVGAYTRLKKEFHYFAPLLTKHTFVANGPFTLPTDDFKVASQVIAKHLEQLRAAANFIPPDYSRISRK
ncbi:MAG: hypothetical protein ACLFTI_13560 [Anaerolineales bacterium]